MPGLHACDRVGLDFIDHAPHRFANSVDLAISSAELFEVLAARAPCPPGRCR